LKNEVVLKSATQQLDLLRSGQISIAELAEAHIEQIERLNPELNAFADFDSKRVRAEARRLGSVKSKTGPLHGLPVSVKSSIATAGYRCEIGSLLHKGQVPSEDAVVVARLRAAGALILGTTNCPEFLANYETDNHITGRTNNPWNLDRTPGGSSGGESAALRRGTYRQLHVAAEQFGFEREIDGETVVVLLNAAEREVEVAVRARDGEWRDLLNGGTFATAGGLLSVQVPASWGRVLRHV